MNKAVYWKCPDDSYWHGPGDNGRYWALDADMEIDEDAFRGQRHDEVVRHHGPMSLYEERDRVIDRIVLILGDHFEGALDTDVAIEIATNAFEEAKKDAERK